MKEESKFWNKFWTFVGIFTFVIPIIPYGLIFAWSYFNPSEPSVPAQTTDTRSVNSEYVQVENNSSADDINY